MPFPMASFTIGVISPLSVATATEMSMSENCFDESPTQPAFTCGTCCNFQVKLIYTFRYFEAI